MRRLYFFDASVDTYTVAERLYELRGPGVRTVTLLEAGADREPGAPRYCLEIDTEDAQDAAAAQHVGGVFQRYTGYHSSLSASTYRVARQG